jgi:hypothetical protein
MRDRKSTTTIRVFLLTCFLVLLPGCTARIFDASILLYSDPSLKGTELKQHGLAFLPVEARPGLEVWATEIDSLLLARLSEARPYAFPAHQAMQVNSRADSLRFLLTRIYFTGEGSAGEIAEELSRLLKTRYLFCVYVESFGDKPAGTKISYYPGYTTPEGTYVPGRSFQSTVQWRGLVCLARIWDGPARAIVWERQCEVASELRHPKNQHLYARLLVQGLIAALP